MLPDMQLHAETLHFRVNGMFHLPMVGHMHDVGIYQGQNLQMVC